MDFVLLYFFSNFKIHMNLFALSVYFLELGAEVDGYVQSLSQNHVVAPNGKYTLTVITKLLIPQTILISIMHDFCLKGHLNYPKK